MVQTIFQFYLSVFLFYHWTEICCTDFRMRYQKLSAASLIESCFLVIFITTRHKVLNGTGDTASVFDKVSQCLSGNTDLLRLLDFLSHLNFVDDYNSTSNVSIGSRWRNITRYIVTIRLTFEGLLVVTFVVFVLGLKFKFCREFSMNSSIRNCLECNMGFGTTFKRSPCNATEH